MRYFIELMYDGSNYHGWQYQPNATTIQIKLEECISLIIQDKVELVAAGRTDTGVHAKQMFAHFDSDKSLGKELLYRINSILPNDIAVINLFKVKEDAHARFSALNRTYSYCISENKNPFNTHCYFYNKKLDVIKMNESAQYLLGKHDFTSFSKVKTNTHTNNCEISILSVVKKKDKIFFTIRSNRFLRNMVRAIVGTLVDVGESKIPVSSLKKILENKNRSLAGKSMPANGLTLVSIEYPKEIYDE